MCHLNSSETHFHLLRLSFIVCKDSQGQIIFHKRPKIDLFVKKMENFSLMQKCNCNKLYQCNNKPRLSRMAQHLFFYNPHKYYDEGATRVLLKTRKNSNESNRYLSLKFISFIYITYN